MLVALLLGFLSYHDVKKREVPNLAVLALFVFSFFLVKDYAVHFNTALHCFAVLILINIITRGGVGGGDIKLLTVLSFFMGEKFYEMMFFAVPVFLTGFTIVFLKERQLNVEVPMVPFIFLSYVLWLGGATWLGDSLF